MKDDVKLKQSNNLILATHEMNIQQMRLFFYACSQYRDDLKVEVPIEDIYNALTENTDNRGGNQRYELRKAIPTMMRNAIVHIVDDEGEGWSAVLTTSKINKDGTVTFKFNKSIQKELEELRGYTWMYLSQLTGMNSTYSVRLYEFFAMRLGSHKTKETFDFDLNKLRLYLGCTKKYKDFRDFNKRVLQQAEKEINEKTNIKMSYGKVKKGRSITSILFTYHWKHKDDAITVETSEKDTLEDQMSTDDYDDFMDQLNKLYE